MKKQEKRIDLYKKINKIGLQITQGRYLEAAKRLKKVIEKAKSYNLDDVVSVAESIYQANKSILDTLNIETTHDLGSIEKLEIPTSKMFYDKKSMRLSFNLPYFTFIGHYKKSTTFEEVLDEFYLALGETKLERKDIYIYDSLNEKKIKESEKIKKLSLLDEEERDSKKEREKFADVLTEKKAPELIDDGRLEEFKDKLDATEAQLKKAAELPGTMEDEDYDDRFRIVSEAEPIEYAKSKSKRSEKGGKKRKMGMMKESMPMVKSAQSLRGPPTTAPAAATAGASLSASPSPASPPKMKEEMERRDMEMEDMKLEEEGEEITTGAPKETTYDINMGLQYYATMMESKSYLFYVYFSHEELKIEDEEGKTVYKTTFQIVTTKAEPPQLDLRIEGIGFEIHPLSGVIEVKKDAINPPIMIFSILPTKSKKKRSKKEKKAGEKRFLNIYIDFEGKNVSHTILSILIQPKHFSLDLGPIHMNLSKGQAMIVSFIPILITVISTVYAMSQIDVSGGSSAGALGGAIPGAGSLVFLITFLYTLLRKGVFPMKQKVAGMLDFDKGSMMK